MHVEHIDNWKEGDRVVTPLHGAGTVVGPEMWTDLTRKDPQPQWLRRWGVKLDDSPEWYTDGIAYYWNRQLRREQRNETG